MIQGCTVHYFHSLKAQIPNPNHLPIQAKQMLLLRKSEFMGTALLTCISFTCLYWCMRLQRTAWGLWLKHVLCCLWRLFAWKRWRISAPNFTRETPINTYRRISVLHDRMHLAVVMCALVSAQFMNVCWFTVQGHTLLLDFLIVVSHI